MSVVRVKAVAVIVLVVIGVMSLAGFVWIRVSTRALEKEVHVNSSPEHQLEQLRSLPQPYSRLLTAMTKREPQLGTDGVQYRLSTDTGVTVADGMYIYNLVRQVKPERTAEAGLAEGYSTLYFFAGLQENGRGVHVAMDPYERDWHGIGVQKVNEAGMSKRFRFVEAKSSDVLPELKSERQSYQMIFIDGDHRFDGAFTDFFLSDAICSEQCYILFHDVWMPSTQKLISFIEHNRNDYVRRPVPEGVNIAAFQKVGKDHRTWQHFADF
jgi:predicted O-methyltransferase YrrM